MVRGEVWWANLAEPSGRRPVVLLSRDAAYIQRTWVTVAPISRTVRGIRAEVSLDEADGMSVRYVANLDDIVTVSKARLENRITALSPEKMAQVRQAILFALALE